MRADVVQDLRHRPLLSHGHVIRRHAPADRSFGIAQQLHRYRALIGREQREQLARDFGGELFEEGGAIVGRHRIEQRGDLFRSHRFHQRVLGVDRQIAERSGCSLAREDPEQEDAVLERELAEHRREIARGAIAQHLPQPSEVARLQHRRELVG